MLKRILAGAVLLAQCVASAQATRPTSRPGRASLSGAVVDEAGQPVAGLLLCAQREQQSFLEVTRTDEAGAFELFALPPTDGKVRLASRHPAWDLEPVDYEWATRGLRVRARPALSFELQVVAQDTGRPVEAFAVQCSTPRATSAMQRGPRLGGRHVDGMVVVDKVWRGANRLVVIPEDRTLQPSEAVVNFAAAPLAPVRIALARRPNLTVRVVDWNGRVVAGSTVELLDLQGLTVEHLFCTTSPFTDNERDHPRCVDTARTDALGRAMLLLITVDDAPLAVRVRGPHHAAFLVTGIQPIAGQPMREIALPRPTRLLGRITPARLAAIPGLRVVAHVGQDWTEYGDDSVVAPIAADGTFVMDRLPAQRVEVGLAFSSPSARDDVLVHQFLQGVGSAVTLRAGQTTELALAAPQLQPGRIRAQLLENGQPARGTAAVRVRSEVIDAVVGEFPLDRDGRFELPAALPGSYTVWLWDRDVASAAVELAPGQTVDWTLRLRPSNAPDGRWR